MKILIAFLVAPLVFFIAALYALYQMISSIPAWLLVAVIVFLAIRLWRRPANRRRGIRDTERRAVEHRRPVWVQPSAPAAPPTVVYVVAPDRQQLRHRSDAPEPWIMR